ncbi:MAG: alpha/beta hydrolase-fold protein [Myxococcota bacterium]
MRICARLVLPSAFRRISVVLRRNGVASARYMMRVETLTIESEALRDNPLGDPYVRELPVIVPEDAEAHGPLPCVWWLAGYSGIGRSTLQHDPWQEGLPARLQRLRDEGRIGPMIVALPDAFTKLGGCQYLSSPAVGDYETYLLKELRDAVESRWSIGRHALAGKSSGGYGALVNVMKHPDLFSAVACHSGDMHFRLSMAAGLLPLMDALRDHGGVTRFMERFERATNKRDRRWFGAISMLALAAVYSPDPSAPMGIGLPFDLETGLLKDDVIERWMAFDPLHMIDEPKMLAALRQMRLVFVDCGTRDEYALYWGALAFCTKLEAANVPHVFESFDGGHRSTTYRLDESMPRLYAALTEALD